MGHKFSEIFDIPSLTRICEGFTRLTGTVTALLDLDGNIHIATGWQDICTGFHRAHPGTSGRCTESDTILAGRLKSGEKYNIYRCKNGLVDIAVPVFVGGEHVANFFTGQFFLEAPDVNYFIAQGKQFGFDEAAYLAALDKVPVFSEEKISKTMSFLVEMTEQIGEMGLAKISLTQAKQEAEEAISNLCDAKEYLAGLLNAIPDLLFEVGLDGEIYSYHSSAGQLLAAPPEAFIGKRFADVLPANVALTISQAIHEAHGQGVSHGKQYALQLPQGVCWFELSVSPIAKRAGAAPHFMVVVHDITKRKFAEDELERQAHSDYLTGVDNRRFFMEKAELEISRSNRYDSSFSLLMIDIDHFKDINDRYGHKTGDLVLQEFAKICLENLRDIDLFGRIGGEEFAAMLPETGLNDAAEAAERLRSSIQNHVVNAADDSEIRFTVSIGIACKTDTKRTLDSILADADKHLYKAKASGRNRHVAASG